MGVQGDGDYLLASVVRYTAVLEVAFGVGLRYRVKILSTSQRNRLSKETNRWLKLQVLNLLNLLREQ